MEPLSSKDIFGNWATLLLPINQDQSIDFSRLADEIDVFVDAGVNGVYSNGSAGEFFNQSEDEFDRVSEMLSTRCEMSNLPFQIGVSHTSPHTSLDRLRRARSLKPGAFQVILPDWFPTTDGEAISFLETMASEAEPIGLVLYNPPHAKRVLEPAVIAKLAERIPSLVGIKVAPHGDQWIEQLGTVRSRLSVFTPGHHLATHYPQGSSGAYSNVACLHPYGAQRWYELIRSDLPAAQRVQQRLLRFLDAYITGYITEGHFCNAAVDKLLAAIGGWAQIGTRLRWPYRYIPCEHAERLRPIAREYVPELFDAG